LVIGRGNGDVKLASATVSRRHARISRVDGHHVI
jgi:hypothetical protein